MIAWEVTDLPEPDSPTKATVSPGFTLNETSINAGTGLPCSRKSTARLFTSSRLCCCALSAMMKLLGLRPLWGSDFISADYKLFSLIIVQVPLGKLRQTLFQRYLRLVACVRHQRIDIRPGMFDITGLCG